MGNSEIDRGVAHPELTEDFLVYLQSSVPPREKWEFISSAKRKYNLSARVVDALYATDRSLFLPSGAPVEYCYSPCVYPILEDDDGRRVSSVSWPEIVAEMTNLLDVQKDDRILEIGGGSGYQMAILAHLAGDKGVVHGVEKDKNVAVWGQMNLRRAGVHNAQMHIGDGSAGLLEYQPYDRVIVTASVPPRMLEYFPPFQQLKVGGRLVAPIGGFDDPSRCHMATIGKREEGTAHLTRKIDYKESCIFVPLQGEHGWDTVHEDELLSLAVEFMSRLGWGVSQEEYFAHLNER